MAEIITMPRLSDTMEIGKIIKWYKKIGDEVFEGDIIAEIETDKAIQDFEIDISGTLLYIGIGEKESAKVDSILAIIGNKNENINELINNIKIKKSNVEKKENNSSFNKSYSISNKIKKNKKIFISPLAKKIANEIGFSYLKINGSGDNGRIIKKDIESYYNKEKFNKQINNNYIDKYSNYSLIKKEIPNSSLRKIIAKRLLKSKLTIPNYYLNIKINMDKVIYYRNIINEKMNNIKISFNDIIVKASSIALKDNPKINSSWNEKKIIYHSKINIGIAVSIEEGLLVPVIHEVDKKSLKEISIEIKDKVIRSNNRKITSNEMNGSTFTISNLGMFGIDSFTSIINHPNSCILSIGSIIKKPIIINSKIVIKDIMNVTLSCDHRIVDGVIGSKFLISLKSLLENPILMLL